LFFRLNVFGVSLPPLRERVEDIESLAEHFLRRFEPRALPLPGETLSYLRGLPWFGNVRELRNALEHAAIVARGGPLLPEHFPNAGVATGPLSPAEEVSSGVRRWLAERVRSNGSAPSDLYGELLRVVEPALLDEVMTRLRGNRWAAAQWLGLNRATVRKKLALYGLHQSRAGDEDGDEEAANESPPLA
jgi:two-component system nitrogen regulation response regulator GlnG